MKRFLLIFTCFNFFIAPVYAVEISTTGYFKPIGPGSEFWPFIPTNFLGAGTLEQQNGLETNPDVFCQQQGTGWRLMSAGDVTYQGRAYNLGFVAELVSGVGDATQDFGNVLPGHPTNYYREPFIPENRIPVPQNNEVMTVENFQTLIGTLADDIWYTGDNSGSRINSLSLSQRLANFFAPRQFNSGSRSFWLSEVSSPDLNSNLNFERRLVATLSNYLSSTTGETASILFNGRSGPTLSRNIMCVKDLQ